MAKRSMANAIRFIHMIHNDGSSEQLAITEDLDTKATDFCPPGYAVENEFTIDAIFPDTFPMDQQFQKIG